MNPGFRITWIDHQREPECAPNPQYPHGIDIDISEGARAVCAAVLDYPAPRCGVYLIECKQCGAHLAVTTAGRVDDPRSVKFACRLEV
jgi:hypothetical protein